ncbi:MAG: hypothetical protein M3347_11595, partial [Armatimonadota bacterium]|nr:hypothetical protein [Armatimonadota bacterium]
MRSALLLLCVVSAVMAYSANTANTKSRRPDLASPESTVRSFVVALNKYDLMQAAMCILAAKPNRAN